MDYIFYLRPASDLKGLPIVILDYDHSGMCFDCALDQLSDLVRDYLSNHVDSDVFEFVLQLHRK